MVEFRVDDIPKEYFEEMQKIRDEQMLLVDRLELNSNININTISLIAGFDTAFDDENNYACSSVVVVDFSTLEIFEEHVTYHTPRIPYIPSFLHYRESPGYSVLFKQLGERPDVLLFDGNGIIHPYGIGLASHMGLDLNCPTIGVAKTLLFGEYIPPFRRGGYSEIFHQGKVIGIAFQTIDPPSNPIFISQGHMINLSSAINIIRQFTLNQKFNTKLPLPLFLANKLAKEKINSE